jgi:hypothetical protein
MSASVTSAVHACEEEQGRLVLVQTLGHGHRILTATVPNYTEIYYERDSEKGTKTPGIRRTQNSYYL